MIWVIVYCGSRTLFCSSNSKFVYTFVQFHCELIFETFFWYRPFHSVHFKFKTQLAQSLFKSAKQNVAQFYRRQKINANSKLNTSALPTLPTNSSYWNLFFNQSETLELLARKMLCVYFANDSYTVKKCWDLVEKRLKASIKGCSQFNKTKNMLRSR